MPAIGLGAGAIIKMQRAGRVVGSNLDGGVEFLEGTVEVGPAQVDHTAVVIGIGKIRPQLQALFVVGKRMLFVALVAVGDAAGIEVADIVRIGVKRGAERGDRPIVIALLDQAVAAIPEGRAPGLAGDLVVGNDGLAGGEPGGWFRLRVATGVDIARGQRGGGGEQRGDDQEKAA